MAAVFIFAATPSSADSFVFEKGGQRLELECDGPSVVETPCRIGAGGSGTQPVRFAAEATRYAHLLKTGADKVIGNKQHALHPDVEEAAILQALALERCHPATGSDGLSGDLLQLCLPADRSKVVLFMRGLCDRCDFEPIVMKRRMVK